MTIEILMLVFVFSLFLGSFYNVVALSTLKKESFIMPSSHCMMCNHKLNMLDMFPVLSYLLLGGKCKYCKAKASPIYPFGELFTAIAYTIVVWKFGFTLDTAIHLVFVTMMILATVSDLKEMMILDRYWTIGVVSITILRLIQNENTSYYIVSALLSFGILLLIMILSRGKIGGGDVKLYALIGISVGLGNAICSLSYASILAMVYFIALFIKRRTFRLLDKDRMVPFVPFIFAGVLLTYIYNMYWYLEL